MFTLLEGKKTYLISLALLSFAVLGLLLGQLDQIKAVELILEALGLAALRSGMAKG